MSLFTRKNVGMTAGLILLVFVLSVLVFIMVGNKENSTGDKSTSDETDRLVVSNEEEYLKLLESGDLTPQQEATTRISLAQDYYSLENHAKAIEAAMFVFNNDKFQIYERALAAELVASVQASGLNDYPAAVLTIDSEIKLYSDRNEPIPSYLNDLKASYSDKKGFIIGEESIGE